MNSKTKVLGFCGNNFQNIGDDAFMLVLADQISRLYRNGEVLLTSGYLPEGLNNQPYVRAIYQDMSSVRFAHLWRLLQNGIKLTNACYFGGSIFHEDIHFQREKIKIFILRKLNPGIRIGALGVSIGPLYSKSQENQLADFLNTLDYVSVRDLPSLTFLEKHQLKCDYDNGFDLAALLLDLYEPETFDDSRQINSHPVLGIAPCPIQRYRGEKLGDDEEWVHKLSLSLKVLSGYRKIRLKFFEFNGHDTQGDRDTILKICKEIDDKFDIEICNYSPDPLRFLKEIRSCNGMLTMRLHSSVFSFLMQVPQVMLSYHSKCSGFANEIGLPSDYIFDVNKYDSETLARALSKMLEENYAYSITLDQAELSAKRQIINFFK